MSFKINYSNIIKLISHYITGPDFLISHLVNSNNKFSLKHELDAIEKMTFQKNFLETKKCIQYLLVKYLIKKLTQSRFFFLSLP